MLTTIMTGAASLSTTPERRAVSSFILTASSAEPAWQTVSPALESNPLSFSLCVLLSTPGTSGIILHRPSYDNFDNTASYQYRLNSHHFRAVLAEKFKGLSDASEAMTIGRMLHEVFQRVLLRRQEVGVSLRGVALKDAVMEEIRAVISTLESLNDL